MSCVDRIVRTHDCSTLGYAVWYLDTHPGTETYAKYIANIAARNIVRTQLSPAVAWDPVV